MGRLQDKLALITGAGRGLAEAMGPAPSPGGATVLVNDLNGDDAEVLARELDGETLAAESPTPRRWRPCSKPGAFRHEPSW